LALLSLTPQLMPWDAVRWLLADKAKQEIMEYYFGERKMTDLRKNAIAIAFRMDGKKSQTHSFFNKVQY
jgi:hypothetical protein